jgi:hypothetical protein
MSFDDGLDVRDAQGRPVSSPKAKADLRALFVSGLCRLLMRPEVPRVARVLSVLERTLDVFRHGLCRALPKSWGDFLDLWSPPAKKLNLMPLFLVAALLALLTPQVSKRCSSHGLSPQSPLLHGPSLLKPLRSSRR